MCKVIFEIDGCGTIWFDAVIVSIDRVWRQGLFAGEFFMVGDLGVGMCAFGERWRKGEGGRGREGVVDAGMGSNGVGNHGMFVSICGMVSYYNLWRGRLGVFAVDDDFAVLCGWVGVLLGALWDYYDESCCSLVVCNACISVFYNISTRTHVLISSVIALLMIYCF